MNEWGWALNAIATSKVIGNAMAAAMKNVDADAATFDSEAAVPLRLIGTTGTTPVAWAVHVPLRVLGYQRALEFQTSGPYPLLTAAGRTEQQIAAAKSAIYVEVGERSAIEASAAAFIASHGYEVIPHGEPT